MCLNTPAALPCKAALREGTRVHWPTNRANWWPGLKRSPASKDKVRSSVRRQLTSTSGFCASACARITAHHPNNWVRSSLKFRWSPRKGIWVAIACINSELYKHYGENLNGTRLWAERSIKRGVNGPDLNLPLDMTMDYFLNSPEPWSPYPSLEMMSTPTSEAQVLGDFSRVWRWGANVFLELSHGLCSALPPSPVSVS